MCFSLTLKLTVGIGRICTLVNILHTYNERKKQDKKEKNKTRLVLEYKIIIHKYLLYLGFFNFVVSPTLEKSSFHFFYFLYFFYFRPLLFFDNVINKKNSWNVHTQNPYMSIQK